MNVTIHPITIITANQIVAEVEDFEIRLIKEVCGRTASTFGCEKIVEDNRSLTFILNSKSMFRNTLFLSVDKMSFFSQQNNFLWKSISVK